jgi:hypothetical protein
MLISLTKTSVFWDEGALLGAGPLLGLFFNPKDGGNKFFQNVG